MLDGVFPDGAAELADGDDVSAARRQGAPLFVRRVRQVLSAQTSPHHARQGAHR